MKILLLDIETAPNTVFTWGLWQQNVGLNQIIKPGRMISWAAKWLGVKKVEFRSEFHDSTDSMLEEIWHLLDEADVVVHFNGTKFDIPHINRELAKHGFLPPSPYRQIDLLRCVKSQFRFPSNKLEWVCTELGIGKKIKHPGMQLWVDCMEGCPKAWRLMRKYNKHDVVLTEELYLYLLPWIKAHPNWGVYIDPDRPACRQCGSFKIQKRGTTCTNMRRYQRYHCTACGTWSRGNKCLAKVSRGLTQ